jgi:hypothetical protein
MIWWFVILALSAGAVLWVGIAAYLRVRRHLKHPGVAAKSGEKKEADNL